jgi:hypothetical protein
MRSAHWLTRGSRWLAGHVARLRLTLDALGTRLRQTVAVAVGQTVAAAVREAVHAALEDFSGAPATTQLPSRGPAPAPGRSLWGQGGYGHPDDADPNRWDDDPDGNEADPRDLLGHHTPPEDPRPAPRWPLAVVVGCQAAAWWVRRRLARLPAVAALAVGLLAALAAYLGGPLTLAGSALNLAGTATALGALGG